MEMVYIGTCCQKNARNLIPKWVDPFPEGWLWNHPRSCQILVLHGVVFYEQAYTEQQKAAESTDGNSNVDRRHPVWKATTWQLTAVKTLVKESENKSARWAELHAVFLALMDK